MVAAGGDEKRGGEAADERVEGEELCRLGPGHEGDPRSDGEHGGEGGGCGQQVVELEGGPEREIQDAAADGFERVGEGWKGLAAEALGPEDEAGTGGEADEDAAGGTDETVLKGELEGPAGADEEGGHADPVEDLGAEAIFKRGARWRGRKVDGRGGRSRGRRGREDASCQGAFQGAWWGLQLWMGEAGARARRRGA